MAAATGNYIQQLTYPGSMLALILGGFLLSLIPTSKTYPPLNHFLCTGYCLAWTLEWFRLITWVPSWEPIQYFMVSMMNLIAAICYYYLAEV